MSVTALLSALVFQPGRIDPGALVAHDPRALADAAGLEQVVPLALHGMHRIQAAGAAVPAAHLEAMRHAARRWTLYEALQRRAMADVLDRAAGVPLLLFKGAALAYALYESPADRMRLDWDVLVEPSRALEAERALVAAGFRKDVKKPGRIRVRQHSYRRDTGDGECAVDLHTGVVNAPALADRVTFEELLGASLPLPGLHPAARGIAGADALVLACLHRLAHHPGEDRLVWDCDIRLLTQRLDERMTDVIARADAWEAGPLVAYEVSRVAARAGDVLPEDTARAVETLAAQPSRLAAFIREDRSRGDDFMLDWRALGWRDRAALVRETFLPDAAFVRARSPSRLPLPLLYIRRLAAGAAAWFRRPGRPDRDRAD
ncbi:MAG TPA: nucleotidyltransferase family protein [Vicinamibacterales bacterium]|nr:nucleotidyltransferase family protein [Vicinamibacterales bacterium]